jgi:putative salt-induced outer membrane protein YdiY
VRRLLSLATGLILVLVLVSLLPTHARADQVSLKNGDRLSGTVVKSDGKMLVLHTDYAGDLNVKWDAVAGIQTSDELHVQLPDGKTATGPVSTSDGKLQVATKAGGTVEANIGGVKGLRNDAEQTAYDKTLHPGLLQDWKTALNVGFALTGGNSQTETLSTGFTGIRQTANDKLGLYANTVYANNNAPGAIPSTTANSAAGGARYDHDVTPRVFGFVAADFFADALQDLNLRSVFGGGAGYHAIKSDTTTLDFLGGLNYTHESYSTFSRNFAALTLGEELMHKVGKGTVINEALSFFPNLNSLGDYRGTFSLATVTKLNNHLGWQNSFNDVYVTNPPLGKKQNDVILITGLNVSFGQ